MPKIVLSRRQASASVGQHPAPINPTNHQTPIGKPIRKPNEEIMDNNLIKICDLHTHSTYSDGSDTPFELARLAGECGIGAIALTDHNSVRGLSDFMSADVTGVELIGGIEFSTDYGSTELHIIALGVRHEHHAAITERVDVMLDGKRRANDELVARLISAGYNIDTVRMREGCLGDINRAHIATELVRCGYVKDRSEAFATLLRKGGEFYIEPKRLDVYETIAFIKSMGLASVLAHPLLNLSRAELEDFLPSAIEAGLDAMECIYSEYDEDMTRYSLDLADRMGLIVSGGSDYHGRNKPTISLGKGKGDLVIPLSVWENIKSRIKG